MPKTQKKVSFKTDLVISSTGSGWHFLIVTKEIVAKFGFEDKYRRVICSMNGDEPFQCALLPWEDRFYIIVNKKKREAIGAVAGDTIDVMLERDESKYGLPMPEEFEEILKQDPEGDKLFHALTAGAQRSILYQLSKSKNIDVRIHQGLLIVEHLKENDGRIVGAKLYDELKRPLY